MVALFSVVVVVLLSMLTGRVATLALTLTGMSHEAARFQARAAMAGIGLTTDQAHDIVAHPVRRRIVFWLMLIGGAGIVTTIASLVVSFGGGSGSARGLRAALLAAVLLALWLLSRTGPVDRALTTAIGRILRARGYAMHDFATLVALPDGQVVAELAVRDGDWIADRPLGELRLRDEGTSVLGIVRPGAGFEPHPGADTVIAPGETIIIYGAGERIAELDRRRRGPGGDTAHRAASG